MAWPSPRALGQLTPFDRGTRDGALAEWSKTCTKLGVTKAIDRFSLAIGIVINMLVDPSDESTKKKDSFHEGGLGPTVGALASEGILVENLEYLRGETHYIAVTVKKVSLLGHGVLLKDRSALDGAPLLGRDNVNDAALLKLARTIVTHVGLPESTAFAPVHPAKLFDFSTRARCLCPFKILGVKQGVEQGAEQGAEAAASERVVAFDLAAQPFLASTESAHLQRAVDEATKDVEARRSELGTLEAEIGEAARKARQKASELAAASGATLNLEEAAAAATSFGELRRLELLRQLHDKEGVMRLANDAQRRWVQSCGAAEDATRRVAVFPIGDSLLEPFWPQGLGSNRGFHSALDACWAVRVLRDEGLEAALLDRHFSYDVMICQPFHQGVIEPGASWNSDYCSRYVLKNVSDMMLMYNEPSAKRLFRGKGAVPPRVIKMKEDGTLARMKRGGT